jgi:phosphoribosylformimino-5-aminoimidazole carboxamide ribotide isomerase
MLIPSIDLQDGRIVQLVQGRDLALATDDIDAWVGRFRDYPRVQLIDLDAAMGRGENGALLQRICRQLRCRVGGGIRSVERATHLLGHGAEAVIVGTALFDETGVNLAAARAFSEALTPARVIAAIDSRGGRVVIKGWTETTALDAAGAARALEPWCDEFLFTWVDGEGLMRGIDMGAVAQVRDATTKRLTVAGGIRSHEEIAELDRLGIDAVVGMALYTGKLSSGPLLPDP